MPPLMRADEAMLFAIPLSGSERPALLQLARQTANGVFSRLEQEFQTLWETAEIYSGPVQGAARQLGADHPKTGSREPAPNSAHAADRPTTATPSEADARRWPRRSP
jgi:hypothetical protein